MCAAPRPLLTHTAPSPPLLAAGSGTIDVKELKSALFAIGQHPSDEEVYLMIAEVGQQQQGRVMVMGQQQQGRVMVMGG